MKLKKIAILATLALGLIYSTSFAQLAEGKIVYELNFPGMEDNPQMAAMMPTEMTLTLKNNQYRMDMPSQMVSTIVIGDSKTKASTRLMEMMGRKTMIKSNEADDAKEIAAMPKSSMKLLDGTKTICGYTCKKAEITVEGQTDKITVWYTPDITYSNSGAARAMFKGIEGFLMDYSMIQKGITIHFVAKSVKAEKVDDSVFILPTGYTEMTQEQMMKSMGGMH